VAVQVAALARVVQQTMTIAKFQFPSDLIHGTLTPPWFLLMLQRRFDDR